MPRLRPVAPAPTWSASISATAWPTRASSIALTMPAIPAPTIAVSQDDGKPSPGPGAMSSHQQERV